MKVSQKYLLKEDSLEPMDHLHFTLSYIETMLTIEIQ